MRAGLCLGRKENVLHKSSTCWELRNGIGSTIGSCFRRAMNRLLCSRNSTACSRADSACRPPHGTSFAGPTISAQPTYQLAAEQGVDYPLTINPASEADLAATPSTFPAILKPATHASVNRFTADKAWPVANRDELLARYREARELIPADLILVQELIPGGGESQFSYAALCCEGQPVASLTARRTRQYPIDFGYSSSFVETLDVPEIVEPSRRLLAAMRYTGLVEVEFKLDAPNGGYKLLDINPRLWTWSALGGRAGVDFPYLLWQMMVGRPVREQTARAGARWVRMSTDVPAAIHEMLRGRLNLGAYLRSLRSPVEFALMAADDPLPGLLDLPLYGYKHIYNKYKGLRTGVPMKVAGVSGGSGKSSHYELNATSRK